MLHYKNHYNDASFKLKMILYFKNDFFLIIIFFNINFICHFKKKKLVLILNFVIQKFLF